MTTMLLTQAACFLFRLSDERRSVVDSWLLCDDYCATRLDSVEAIGGRAVPKLVRALVFGPQDDRRATMTRQIEASYARLVDYVAPAPVAVSESAYVQRFMDNYVATYQKRAVIALRRISTSSSRRALREALGAAQQRRYRGDVIGALGDVLRAALVIQSADSQSAPANTLVGDPPSLAVQDSAGNPLKGVRVIFAIDSGGGVVIDSVQQTDGNGVATVGGWRLGANPGRKTLRASAAGRATRFVAIATP